MTFSFKSEEWKRTVSKRVAIVFLRIYHWPPMCVSIKYPYPPQPPRKVTRNSEGEGGSKAANLVCVCVGGGGVSIFSGTRLLGTSFIVLFAKGTEVDLPLPCLGP